MLKPGVSIVISPLKSLMKDQIDNLKKYGFENVDYIDSSLNPSQKKRVIEKFKGGYIKIVYVSPERLLAQNFQNEILEMIEDYHIDYLMYSKRNEHFLLSEVQEQTI